MRSASHPSYRTRLWVLAFSLFVLFTPRSGWSAPGWYYGPAQSTSIISCFSLIFPPPYFVTGVEVNVGQLLDAANPPVVGEVFFIQLTVAAIGDSCSGTFGAAPEFRLPPGVSPAISDETPLSCVSLDLGTQQVTPLSACPAAPTVAIWGGTHSVPAGGDISNAWVVPRGKVLMITLPVVASRPLSFTNPADRIGAAVKIIDSNLSPVLFPNVDAWVVAATPPPVTPTPTPPVATPTQQPQPTVVPTAPPPLRLTTITAYEDAIKTAQKMVRGGVSIKERKALVKIAKFLSSLRTSGEGKALLARYPNLGGGAAKLLAELKKRSPSSSRLSSLLKRLGVPSHVNATG